MLQAHYLLIIDQQNLNNDLKRYFAQFNIHIVQQKTLDLTYKEQNMPIAVLINKDLIKHHFKVIHSLYQSAPIPIIIISDEKDEESCITMLEAGADDFILKPLYPRELHARIGAITRRVLRAQQQKNEDREVFIFTHWRLYPASRQVFNEHHQELQLSVGEYDLLLAFIQQPQQILDREFLLHSTKNSDLNPFDRRIDVQISRLRQKIEVDNKKPRLIKTIRNGGYLFTAQVISLKERANAT